MNILLHACCAPCLAYPARELSAKQLAFTIFPYNPNIHPFNEYTRRTEQLIGFCKEGNIAIIEGGGYGLRDFLRQIVFHEDSRCHTCYTVRLRETAAMAVKLNFSHFSSTLLYSRYQQHNTIIEIASALAKEFGISFYYQDFRKGWQEGIRISKEKQMYRQQYCGCIYSEQERYDTTFQKGKNL